jgi:hypothetical protein
MYTNEENYVTNSSAADRVVESNRIGYVELATRLRNPKRENIKKRVGRNHFLVLHINKKTI